MSGTIRPDLSGHTVAGKFRLDKRIGRGHFGDVYAGRHLLVGRQFAIKIIPVSSVSSDPSLEAKLQNLSTHPNIVRINSAEYWMNEDAAIFFLIEMEYVSGGSLEEKIAEELSIKELSACLKNILFALNHAHPEVIHRDVKPANILLGGGGKLSDFGIAMVSVTGESANQAVYNRNLAPECFGPYASFSPQSDIFAAGLTLLRGLNLIADWRSYCNGIPDFRSKMIDGSFVKSLGFHPRVPKKLKSIVKRACETRPEKRFAAASAFRDALESLKFERDWRTSGSDSWQCLRQDGEERIEIEHLKNSHQVVYFKNKRMRRPYTKNFIDKGSARAYAYEVMAETSLS